MYKVNYIISFLKGIALDYFELSLMDPHANPAGPMITTNLFPNSGPTLVPSTLKLMLKMSLNSSKCVISRKLLNTLSAFSSSPPKSIGAMLPSTTSSTLDFLAASRTKSQESANVRFTLKLKLITCHK